MGKIEKRFRCDKCGKFFDWPVFVKEYMGEFWGVPAYDEFPYSPCCHSDFTDLDDEDPEEVDDEYTE
jgi:hypothetical protein